MDDPNKPKNSFIQAVGLYGGVGIQFAVSVALGAFGGSWLDKKLATDPWVMILGVILGAAAGFYNLVRLLNKK